MFRKNRAFGFVASPVTLPDGTQVIRRLRALSHVVNPVLQNLMKWECSVPGKDGTLWAGGSFPLTIIFRETYPVSAPICQFPP